MKKLILIALTLIVVACAGIERSADAGKPIEYILDVPGKTKDQLFSASKSWIAETFVSGKSVIDDADKDSGRIVAKGQVKHPCGEQSHACGDEYIGFILRLDTKEGKIRMTFTDATVISPATSGNLVGVAYIAGQPETRHPVWMVGELADTKKAFKALSDSLQSYAANDSAASKNW
jgi:hypothetical protein